MVSAISEWCTDSVVLEGKDRVKKVSGKLAGQYKPGHIVYESSTGTWTQATGTQSFNVARRAVGIVEFKYRTSTTFGEVDIDTAYTKGTAENVEIIIGPLDGTIKVACFAKAFGSAGLYGQAITTSSGGKAFAMGSSFAAIASMGKCGIVTEEGYTSGDTVCKMYMVSG